MARKQKAPEGGPSKAYLVSFGDTMTALLAFFIVLNSLATEQTGAKMYSGTGSFVNAFSKSGTPGKLTGNRSTDMIQRTSHAPIYALRENLDKNENPEKVGPDDTDENDQVKDRAKEKFQKFLSKIEKHFGLTTKPPISQQVVFDSFVPFNRKTGRLSEHAIQLAAEMIPKLRKPNVKLEVVIWVKMPSKKEIDRTLEKSLAVKEELETMFWIKGKNENRIRYSAKPWLFSDAKRPIMSFVLIDES